MKHYPLAKPDIDENDINAVNAVLRSNHLSRGPAVAEFERQFCQLTGCAHACAVSSGTAGLIIALQALGVVAGDEVITVSFTVPATVNSIVAIGAVPVMVDIESDSLGMDVRALQSAISVKTRAIIVVHAFGQAAPIVDIMQLARQHGLKVIEDACEAVGNHLGLRHLGRFADIGVFGFYPNKQITTGEGGMMITDDVDLLQSCQLLRNHGRQMNGDLFDQTHCGWNARLSDINAALGVSQLHKLPIILAKRRALADCYQQQLEQFADSIECPTFDQIQKDSAWFVYVVRLKQGNRDGVYSAMAQAGIQCGRYFAPVHQQPYYRQQCGDLELLNTERIASQCLALPFYPQLQSSDVVYICDKLIKIKALC